MSRQPPQFNLVDEPWIPCVMPDGTAHELSLRETLARAADIRELSDPSPAVTVALHRLLLAVLHRSLQGPDSAEAWHAIWTGGAFDMQRVGGYLDAWRHRFNLFDAEHPFYQNGNIGFDEAKPLSYMVHGMVVGNNAMLFDHSIDEAPPPFAPAAAARYLVALHSFALGGFVSSVKGEDRGKVGSADASPLARGIVTLITGETLFQTLLLNLVQYDAETQLPFPFRNNDPALDRPAWERDEPTKPVDRNPDGYVDLLTWQSRRARLQPEHDETGEVVVRRASVMKGYQFETGWEPWSTETMLAFRKNLKPTGTQGPYSVLSFSEARSLWRDSDTLFGALTDAVKPRTIGWIATLAEAAYLPPAAQYQLTALGVLSDRKSIDFWRTEQLPLAPGILDTPALLDRIQLALNLAERVGKLFQRGFDDDLVTDNKGRKVSVPRPLHVFAEAILAPGDRSPDPGDVARLVEALEPAAAYWPALEAPFKQFLLALPEQPDAALAAWIDAVEAAARAAFEATMLSFDTSARALKAAASAEERFRTSLAAILRRYRDTREEDAHAQPIATPA